MTPRLQLAIETLTQERRRFEHVSRSLSTEELARHVPGSTWTVKDFVIHVATLDAAYRGWFRQLAGGAVESHHRGSPDFNVDDFNEAAVAGGRQLSLNDILTEGARLREAMIADLSGIDEAQLDATVRFGGDGKRAPRSLTLADLLSGWPRHDVIHVADMMKALPERREDAEVATWLREPDAANAVAGYQHVMS